MRFYAICVGEPIPTTESNVRIRRVGTLCTHLAKRKNDVHWITSTFDHYKKVELFNKDVVYNYNGFTIHALKTIEYKKNISLKRIKFHKKIAIKIYNYLGTIDKPDVIYTSMEPIEVFEKVSLYGKENGIKVVTDVRDLWPEIFYDVFPKVVKPILFPYVSLCKRRLKKNFNRIFSIVAPSKGFLEYGLKYSERLKNEQDRVFNMGYTPTNVVKKSDGKFNVVFFGTIGKQFDLVPVLEAAKKLIYNNDIKFYIAGDGVNLNEFKKKYSLKNIEFTGWIEKEKIQELLSVASIGLAPYINSVNYQNNMPNKIGEYLSIGLPILVNCDGIIPETLIKYECGYKYSSENDLYEKILYLYNNKEKYNELSVNANKCFNKEMNADNIYEEMSAYFENIVSEENK